ncbi:MAG TPA: RNA chaperone Hfq [Terracidiphilus sp.]
MSIPAILPAVGNQSDPQPGPPQVRVPQLRAPQLQPPQLRTRKSSPSPLPFRFPAHAAVEEAPYRNAELFYLQKQIQSQTPMVIVLEDGEHLEGCIEWYDRNTLKVRGRLKTLVYKSAIKYMYKVGDFGQ